MRRKKVQSWWYKKWLHLKCCGIDNYIMIGFIFLLPYVLHIDINMFVSGSENKFNFCLSHLMPISILVFLAHKSKVGVTAEWVPLLIGSNADISVGLVLCPVGVGSIFLDAVAPLILVHFQILVHSNPDLCSFGHCYDKKVFLLVWKVFLVV